MTKHLSLDDPLLAPIGDIADTEQVRSFAVGGYVRDSLLGKNVKDLDVVVLGDGVAFAQSVSKAMERTNLVVFPKFGTAMLVIGDRKVEFVGARKESYEKTSRKPAVQEGSLDEDLLRRDFTVNAIAVSLNKDDRGKVFDPLHGEKDLRKRILRTPLDPAKTFDDDPLRIMRAMRFAAQLGFTIDDNVLTAAEEMRDRIRIVSQERISDELLKLLASPKPSVGFLPMFQTGVLEIVFPEMAQLAGVDQRKDYHHKDVFLHTLKVIDNISQHTDDIWLRMAALLHDIAKPRTKAFKPGTGWTFHGHEEVGARMVRQIFRRLKLPLDHVPYVEKLVRLHLRPMSLVDEEVTDSAVRRLLYEAGEEVDDLMLLCRADITSKNPKLVREVKQNYDAVAAKMAEVEEKDRMRNWQPALKGDEIMEICGIGPGRKVGELKQAVVDAILDGEIPNEHEAALEYLLKIKDQVLQKPEIRP